jgi:hypothetical protein
VFSRVELPPTWAHVFSGPDHDHPQVTIESRPNLGSAASSGPGLQEARTSMLQALGPSRVRGACSVDSGDTECHYT